MSTISASTTSTTAYKVTADTTGTLVLQTGSTPTTAVTIDASQNVGLGVTPSAWRSIQKSLDIGVAASVTGFTALPYLRSYANAYINSGGSVIYKINGEAGAYTIDGNVHAWYNAASGTAGNAITFTQAMTLDANGKLIVGNTSSIGSPYIQSKTTNNTTVSGSYVWNSSDQGILLRNDSNTANTAIGLTMFGGSSGNSVGAVYMVQETANALGALAFYTGGSSAGSPYAYERARIDSSGNLLVGTTSATGGGTLTNCPSGWGIARYLTDQSGRRNWAVVTESLNAGDICLVASTTNNGSPSTVKFQVRNDGSTYNGTGTYGTISDIKLKENVVDATPKLDSLMQVRVVNYNRIGEERKELGVIAQELEQIFPGMIDEAEDLVDGQPVGTTTKAVKYSVFVPMLIKAIQEQQAIIETLTNRITALEAK